MNKQNQLLCAWSGPVCVLLLYVGFWPVAHFFPPLLPSAGAVEIAGIYQQDTNSIRAGMILGMLGSAFLLPFSVAIAMQLKRIEGNFPVMAYTELGAGAIDVLVLTIPVMLFTVTAFRPERSTELTLLLNDMSWILFVMPFGPAAIQSLAIGFAILSDRNPQPIFPRWVGFFNFWVALLFTPAALLTFFRTGPFAWNGLLAFWVPVGAFGLWFFVMFYVLLRAIRLQSEEEQ